MGARNVGGMTDHHAPDGDAVSAFYNAGFEESRLDYGIAQLERIRTRKLLALSLPSAPATVLDIGGGAGAHAFWLAKLGYTVHLLDAADRLIEAARQRSANAEHVLASVDVGDARVLPYASASADALLLLGPLYHLTSFTDRAQALSDARRVLKPGGVLFAAAITRWAGALYGLGQNLYLQPGFEGLIERTLADGQNRNPLGLRGGFTTAYFHRPDEFATEIADAGFLRTTLHGIEGPACMLPDFETRWNDRAQRRMMLTLADTLGTEPSLLGVSAHLMAIGFAPAPLATLDQALIAAAKKERVALFKRGK